MSGAEDYLALAVELRAERTLAEVDLGQLERLLDKDAMLGSRPG